MVDLGAGRTAISLSLGFSHTCAILDDNSVKCWGRNNGQLGINSLSDQNTPQTVHIGSNELATKIISGNYHNCVVTNFGNLHCWGSNSYGQLGDNSTTDKQFPTLIDSIYFDYEPAGEIFGRPTVSATVQIIQLPLVMITAQILKLCSLKWYQPMITVITQL